MKLKKKDLLGKSDPYVKLRLTEDKLSIKKTTVKHSNLNPEWNEEFSLVVKDPESQALELIVYDWEQVISPHWYFSYLVGSNFPIQFNLLVYCFFFFLAPRWTLLYFPFG